MTTRRPSAPQMRRRLHIVGGCLAVAALLPLAKLVSVQFTDASALAAKGLSQRRTTEDIPALRGSILDRNGSELAISVARSSVAVNKVILARDGIDDDPTLREYGTRLAELLGVDPVPVGDALVEAKATARWVQVAKDVDPEVAERARAQLAAHDMAGALMIDPMSERVHPAGESALRVVGTLGPDGPGPRAGIEAEFDEQLQGRDGERVVERAPDGDTITGSEHTTREPRPGADVQLTLDRTLQYETEQILARGAENSSAAGGIAIVGNPTTGELLAVAGVERDPTTGEITLSSSPLAFSNAYQAGSVFKLVTVAAAYEAGVIDDSSTFEVPSSIEVYDREFSDNEQHGVEAMNVDQIVAKSSNVGTIKISQLLGKEKLHDALEAFGFGSTTGVGHPAESPGLLPGVKTWTPPDTAAAAIGTFQSTTVLQLWSAYNVIANKGVYVPPRLVEGTVGPDGRLDTAPAAPTHRVVSASSAAKVGRALRAVVQQGTGKQWDLPGYPVAAKTGTGRMPSPEKVAKDDDYVWPDGLYHHVTTFAGYLPADRPQVSITVMLLDTAQGLTGSTSAGPVFSDLAKLSIRELSIAPSADDGTAVAPSDDPIRSAPAVAASGATQTAGGGASTRSGSASTTMATTTTAPTTTVPRAAATANRSRSTPGTG